MIANRRKIVCAFFGLALCAGANPAAAQEGEIRSGRNYSDLRAALLRQGWKPDSSYGLKVASGAPLYRFPEVLCGPQMCRAKWRDRAGQPHAIMLFRGHGADDHRVSPQQ
jgi:hypothetical protein